MASMSHFIRTPHDMRVLPVSYYDLLAVSTHATTAEIKAAYLRQLQRYSPHRHVMNTADNDSSPLSPYPDAGPLVDEPTTSSSLRGDYRDAAQHAEAQRDWDVTLMLYHVYQTLSDPAKRAVYDDHLRETMAQQQRLRHSDSGLEAFHFVGDVFQALHPLMEALLTAQFPHVQVTASASPLERAANHRAREEDPHKMVIQYRVQAMDRTRPEISEMERALLDSVGRAALQLQLQPRRATVMIQQLSGQ